MIYPAGNDFHLTRRETLRTEAMIAWKELAGTCTPA
jgi:hypothetical protein